MVYQIKEFADSITNYRSAYSWWQSIQQSSRHDLVDLFDFKSFSSINWVTSGYLIANAASRPLFRSTETDIFGRRASLVFFNVCFGAGTLMCGIALRDGMLILGQVMAGASGGGLNTISTFVASDLVPLRERRVVKGWGELGIWSWS